MNERIRKLVEQAALATNEDPNGEYPAHMMQKFAELIIQECCDVLYDNELGGYQVNYVLKEYFGVES